MKTGKLFTLAILSVSFLGQISFAQAQQEEKHAETQSSPKAKIVSKQVSGSNGKYEFEIEFWVDGELLSIDDIDLEEGEDGTLGKLTVMANHLKAMPVTFAAADFDSDFPVHQYTFGFAGYQNEDGKQFKAGDALAFTRNTSRKSGTEQSGATVGIVDTSDLEIPESAKMNFLGCAVGMNLAASEDLSKVDLSKIEVSFDAKVKGCKPLKHTKVLIGFLVDNGRFPAGADGPANARFDDVVCKLIRGDRDEKELLTINSEFQNFRFNLAKDFEVQKGKTEDLKDHPPQRMAFILQAAGTVEDTGLDADNAVIVDNVQFQILP